MRSINATTAGANPWFRIARAPWGREPPQPSQRFETATTTHKNKTENSTGVLCRAATKRRCTLYFRTFKSTTARWGVLVNKRAVVVLNSLRSKLTPCSGLGNARYTLLLPLPERAVWCSLQFVPSLRRNERCTLIWPLPERAVVVLTSLRSKPTPRPVLGKARCTLLWPLPERAVVVLTSLRSKLTPRPILGNARCTLFWPLPITLI